jgi:NADH-ubiquinone oxidoreductase chain 2
MLLIGLIILLSVIAISTNKSSGGSLVNLNKAEIDNLNSYQNTNIEEWNNSSINNKKYYYINRTSVLILIFAGILSIDCLYIKEIGKGISIYNGLYQITNITQSFDYFLFTVGAIILMISSVNPLILNKSLEKSENLSASALLNTNLSKNKKETMSWINNFIEKIINNKSHTNNSTEYSIIILFNIIGASWLISSMDIISIYIGIELQSFALYILATLEKNSESSSEGGLKYFLLGGLSSCFILLGIGLIYNLTGLTNIENISIFYSVYNHNDLSLISNEMSSDYRTYQYLEIAISLILIGFLFKVSAAPFHNWAPDVYDDVPTIITLWLSVMTKISLFIFLVILLMYFPPIYEIWEKTNDHFNLLNQNTLNWNHPITTLLMLSCLFSLLVGTIVGIVQFRIKRLLAYSTISHVGFLLLGLLIMSEESIEAFLFYLLQYTLSNANNFMILLGFGYIYWVIYRATEKEKRNNHKGEEINKIREYSPIQYIEDLKGQYKWNPWLVICFTISLFSLAGIPPLVGFFGKQFILLAALKKGYLLLSLVAILTSVISAAYYLRIIKVMFFENKESTLLTEWNLKNTSFYLSNLLSFNISVLTLFTLFFFFKPYLILNWISCLVLYFYIY